MTQRISARIYAARKVAIPSAPPVGATLTQEQLARLNANRKAQGLRALTDGELAWKMEQAWFRRSVELAVMLGRI